MRTQAENSSFNAGQGLPEHTITAVISRAAQRPRWMRYAFDKPEQQQRLGVEPRRALALLRALDLGSDARAAAALLEYAGVQPKRDADGRGVVISDAECQALAAALRRDGYALDNEGVCRFKVERGYSKVVRIGPSVAEAYVRHARGAEARLVISPEDWRGLDTEARRTAQILLLIGHNPKELTKVYEALQLPIAAAAVPGTTAVVDPQSIKALAMWCDALGITFSDDGLGQMARALQRAYGSAARSMAQVARFLADAIVACDEPAHDYQRLAAPNQNVVNRRTWLMLREAQQHLLSESLNLRILRGSYCAEPIKGAHPHNGGGVVDLVPDRSTPQNLVRAIAALRRVGFAAWYRPRPKDPHIHAVAIGDREMTAAAQWQVKSYFQGRDGRSRSQPDPHARIAVTPPAWATKYAIRYC